MGAALVALSAALAAYVMVKFFGVIFLGQPREPALARARDAGVLERIGLIWLALGCVLLGLLPTYVIDVLRTVVAQFSDSVAPDARMHPGGCWCRSPAGKPPILRPSCSSRWRVAS